MTDPFCFSNDWNVFEIYDDLESLTDFNYGMLNDSSNDKFNEIFSDEYVKIQESLNLLIYGDKKKRVTKEIIIHLYEELKKEQRYCHWPSITSYDKRKRICLFKKIEPYKCFIFNELSIPNNKFLISILLFILEKKKSKKNT